MEIKNRFTVLRGNEDPGQGTYRSMYREQPLIKRIIGETKKHMQ